MKRKHSVRQSRKRKRYEAMKGWQRNISGREKYEACLLRKSRSIKPFKTLEEEAHFWDTHDVSGLLKDPKASLSSLSNLEKEKEASITIRVQKSVKTEIDSLARQKGISPSTLSRMWIIEKMREYVTSSDENISA